MKTINDFKVKGKKVLVRCDFNVPLNKKGKIEDDLRIRKTLPTIEYLIKNKAKVILISHLGSPNGRVEESLRLDPVAEKLKKYFKEQVFKAQDCIGKEVEEQISKLKEGQILLLENLRFHKGEEKNDPKFIKELAKLADIYINDAFGVCHRKHASVVGIVKHLPSGAGLLLEKEVKILSKVLKNPWRPLVIIIGGAKVSSKIRMIKQFEKTADYMLVGGKIADTIFTVKGVAIGKPWPSEEGVKAIEKIKLTSNNLYLPIDNLVSPDDIGKTYIRQSAPAKARKDEFVFDIGPETINIFSKIIKEAKMIFWSGPLGFFENPLFERGTREIAEKVVRNHRAYKIAGGGDTLFALSKFGLIDKFDHISTGGGAMLAFLGKEKLPGLSSLGFKLSSSLEAENKLSSRHDDEGVLN